MPAFANPMNENLTRIEESSFVEHGIDIVDYETVCYDKNGSGVKRSLSLNIYKYDKILEPEKLIEAQRQEDAPCEIEEPPNKEKLKDSEVICYEKRKPNVRNNSQIPYLIWMFIIIFSIACVSMLGFVSFKVFKSSDTGILAVTCYLFYNSGTINFSHLNV